MRAKNHLKLVKERPEHLRLRGHRWGKRPEEELALEVSMEVINGMGVQEEGARNPEEIPLPQSDEDEEGQEEAEVQEPLAIQEGQGQGHLDIQEELAPAQHQEPVLQEEQGQEHPAIQEEEEPEPAQHQEQEEQVPWEEEVRAQLQDHTVSRSGSSAVPTTCNEQGGSTRLARLGRAQIIQSARLVSGSKVARLDDWPKSGPRLLPL